MVLNLSKILVPQRPAALISRPRIRSLIHTASQRRLLVLTAPAGAGKTYALIDFASTTPLPVAWYTLDRGDTDPHTFARYLHASLLQIAPQALRVSGALLESGLYTNLRTLSATLSYEVALLQMECILVLDNWSLVDQHAACADLVRDIVFRSRHCHVILAGTSFPTMHNLLALTARRQLNGIGEHDLRFTQEEATAILAAHPGMHEA